MRAVTLSFPPLQNNHTKNMKIRILPILSSLLALAITSCVSVDETAAPAAASPGPVYDLGITKGRQDGSSGLSRSPARHMGALSQAEQVDFLRGYEDGYNAGTRGGQTAAPAKPASIGQPLTAVNGAGTVTIMEGQRNVAVCRTASPNVEQTRFITEQQQIVVKSRGAHGPATVQLFDTATGAEKDRVMAFDIKGNQPAWAAGMGE